MSKFFLVFIVFFICICYGESHRVVLVDKGIPKAKIVISSNPTKVSQFAAFEIQYHIEKITGAKLPIVKDDEEVSGNKILVGESRYTKKYRIRPERFKEQEYLIKFYPSTIILIGRDSQERGEVQYLKEGDFKNYPKYAATWPDIWDEQGTLYATYDFLEKFCGVKWLNPTEFGTVYPKKKTLIVEGDQIKRAPFFKYRDVYTGVDYDAAICLWKRNTEEYNRYLKDAYPSLPNPADLGIRRVLHKLFFLRMKAGGKKCFANHSLYHYYKEYPPDKYPEIWAKGYEGQPNQLCYTSEKLIELVAKEAEEYFKLPEKERKWGKDCFAVVPMDNRAFCKCEKCQELIKRGKEGEGMFYSTGTYSDYFFNFVNEVAKRVKKTNPDKWIITLAYDGYAGYPKTIELEPNVAVMFCFATNRGGVGSEGYFHEIELLKEWAEKSKKANRPLELWLYYTFPKETADNGNFHCFPGFFAHKIKEQFSLFKKLGIKGMFHCGYGQEVEAYVTFKLMDNPDLNIDKLLNEYFNSLYGNAAEPMKNLYLFIEEIYTNRKNYPSQRKSLFEISWGYLGTKERMEKMGKLLEEAKQKANTDYERTNIKLFEDAIWSYMVAGYNKYQKRISFPFPEYKVPKINEVKGDIEKIDWEKGMKIGPWYVRGSDQKSERKMEGIILHDGEYLYLKLIDFCETENLVSSSMVFPCDDWEIFIAKQRGIPYRQIAFNPKGLIVVLSHGEINFRMNLPVEHNIKVVSKIEKDKWISEVAIPFSDISVDGLKKGEKVYFNIVRVSSSKIAKTYPLGIDVLVPFTTVHDTDLLAELKLENFD